MTTKIALCSASALLALGALVGCSKARQDMAAASPSPTMGTRTILPKARTVGQGTENAKRIIRQVEALWPEVSGWRFGYSDWYYCDSAQTQRSVYFEMDGHTSRTPNELLRTIEELGPKHGIYPEGRPVTNGNGLQVVDLRPDGYQVAIDAYNYGLVGVGVRIPCLRFSN